MTTKPFRIVRFVVFMMLILSNCLLAYLYYKESAANRALAKLAFDTHAQIGQIQESLNQKDIQKAYTHLADAQKKIASYLPPPPRAKKATAGQEQPRTVAAQPAPAATSPAAAITAATTVQATPMPKAVALVIPPDKTPQPFLLATAGEHLLLCEKDHKTLHLFRFGNGKFNLVKSYPCIVGANHNDKKEAGDLATPKGTYFFMRFTPGSSLPEKYGYGAFVLNYPNFLDRKDRKNGTGIWLHGHSTGKNIGQEDLQNTKGCIVVSNEDLKELAGLLKPSGTPITVVGKLDLATLSDQNQTSMEIMKFVEGWRQAWESGNTKKYIGYFGKEFVSGDGMGYEAFRRHKEKVNSSKKFIRVKMEDLAILLPPEQNGQIAVVRFIQKYRSNNFDSDSNKLFYLKHGQTGWRIIGESVF
jgi:murein L,D-transpeptidase YafK